MSYPEFAYSHKLIGMFKYVMSSFIMEVSRTLIRLGDRKYSFYLKEEVGMPYIEGKPKKFNPYDIRRNETKDFDEYIIEYLLDPNI